jgi:hypothetical protein
MELKPIPAVLTVRNQGTVLLKFVTSSDGNNVGDLVRAVNGFMSKKGRIPALDEAYDLARYVNFGDQESLIVMDRKTVKFLGMGVLSEQFRETFNRPKFAPNVEKGSLNYIREIRLRPEFRS